MLLSASFPMNFSCDIAVGANEALNGTEHLRALDSLYSYLAPGSFLDMYSLYETLYGLL